MFNPMSLEGKRILITGASSGIGAACAIAASKLGATLVLTSRRETALNETLSKCSGSGHLIVPGDITRYSFVQELVAASEILDGFVHAAGIAQMIPARFLSEEKMLETFRVNLFSFLQIMSLLSQRKYHRSPFSAVAISSTSAFVGVAGGAVYCASKGALTASIKALAVELASKGIRVNSVCPATIRTPMFEREILGNAQFSEGLLAKISGKQPLGIGQPEQVANAVCFLLSEASSFMTGTDLIVDGGKLAL